MDKRTSVGRVGRSNGGVSAATGADLRGANLERVLFIAMDRGGPFTRTELIEASGLSAPPSRGGRRPVFMEFDARHGFVAERPQPVSFWATWSHDATGC